MRGDPQPRPPQRRRSQLIPHSIRDGPRLGGGLLPAVPGRPGQTRNEGRPAPGGEVHLPQII